MPLMRRWVCMQGSAPRLGLAWSPRAPCCERPALRNASRLSHPELNSLQIAEPDGEYSMRKSVYWGWLILRVFSAQ
jgi:hypothetical protein